MADEELEYIKEVIEQGSTEEKLNLVEELLGKDRPAQAQNVLDSVDVREARWHYLQSKVFMTKDWVYESKKQLEIALQLEPGNEKYKEELQKLNELGETPPHSEKSEKPEMDRGSCKQACAEMSCYACCECMVTGLCEAICNGCN